MRSLILVDGIPNETTAPMLTDLGLGGAVGAGWPRADLEVDAGRVRVRSDGWDNIAAALEQSDKRSVEAFYLGNLADLEVAHGSRVGYKGRAFELRRVSVDADDSPYVQRLLSLTWMGAGPIEGANSRIGTGVGSLCLNPLRVDVEELELETIGFAGDPLNAVLLPPDDPGREWEYLSPDSVAIRSAFREWLIEASPRSASTLAVRLLAAFDDPLVRPFLKDGGMLDVTRKSEGPSRFELCPGQATPVARYRDAFFRPDGGRRLPTLGSRVREVLREDLLVRVPLGPAVRGGVPQGWRDYELVQVRDPLELSGSFQQVRELARDLGLRVSVEARSWIDERVLEPARPRLANVAPNHSLAEQAFLREFARVPWAPEGPNWAPGNEADWAWRTALIDLMRAALGDRAAGLRAVDPPWISSNWHLDVDPNGLRIVRYPEQDEGQVLRWRLLETPGALFLRDAKSQIGVAESMRLGETLRLS